MSQCLTKVLEGIAPCMAQATQQESRPRTITPRDNYHDLTDKMQAVVDAAANNPDAGHKELARIASDELDGDTVSRSYVPAILEQQGHIIEERREIAANRRYEGDETTEGDPFESLQSDDAPQHITERPHKGTDDEARVTVEFKQADVQQALTDPDAPTWLKECVTDALVKQAFA